jgi:hypothetical protein
LQSTSSAKIPSTRGQNLLLLGSSFIFNSTHL